MRSAGVLLTLILAAVILSATVIEDASLAGFASESARFEREWENKFRAIPLADNQREYMKRMSARPHHVGSPYDQDNAAWLLAKLKEWGLDAHIENFDVLFPTPRERLVELVEPAKFTASLQEPALAIDPTSNQQTEQLPTYNAYSIDGDVTAPLVYVNYGIPDDYEQLERRGISVKGAIVIARYGQSWRGIKPKVAAEHGAVGCLIYSDPRDDGYFEGNVFPEGGLRNKTGVQRGSVMDMPTYPGDPLTPGTGATPDAKRLDIKDVKTLTRIPVLPISYGDAQPLLGALKGPLAPESWRGALPITYHMGPGPAKVHLRVKANWDIKRLNDIIVKIPGATYPDEWIVRGNHHDAWVNGAEDPVSGAAALLEEARALGELLKQGWRPKRTIIYCLWDGEEPGLLGSTEWAEAHAAELRDHAAVYINTDANGRGFFYMGGSHSLEGFVNAVVRDIEDPEKKISVWKRLRANQIVNASSEDERKEARSRIDLRMEALGSGSDWTVFLDHLGIASLNLGYGGEDEGGIYHSIYDDFYWYTHFSDTDFSYGRALSQTVGTAVMRLADADLLPYDFRDLADTVHKYGDELQKLVKTKQDEIANRNLDIEEGVLTANSDPKETYVPPKSEPNPPHLNFAPYLNASEALTRSADRYQKALAKATQNGGLVLPPATLHALNTKLISSERKLVSAEGLPGRPWFKHQIYAPGFYTGYAVKTVPGVREAIEQKRWKEADEQIARVGAILQDEAALIDGAAAELEEAAK
ncbi:MAG TPA: transferrin receptor-like dimerization domain-containing protein [Terriglobales bacterium]|jgi:N-acetylated-alpha-linked acidic dipeptidase